MTVLVEKAVAFVLSMGICTVATLGVAAVDHRCRHPFRWPERTNDLDRLQAWVRDEVRDDLATVSGYGWREGAVTVAETVVAVGLVARCLLHAIVVFVASPDGDHDATWHWRADPITSERPAWNRVSARVTVGIVGLWAARNYPTTAIDPALDPTVVLLVKAFMVANGAVLIGDPGLELVSLINRLRTTPTHGN